MSVGKPVIQGIYTLLASGVRAATQTFTEQDVLAPLNSSNQRPPEIPDASGIEAFLNVTVVPGVDTVQLVLEAVDPVSGTVATVLATTATAVTGLVRLKLYPGIVAVAASVTQIQSPDVLPAKWRLRVVHSAATNFTYSLGLVVYA